MTNYEQIDEDPKRLFEILSEMKRGFFRTLK